MMRTLAASLAVAICTTLSDAQSIRVTPLIGGTEPQGGSMTMWVPIPATVGFDSIPQRYTYDAGRSYGVLLEWDRASWLDFAALATVNQARRGFTRAATVPECDVCESTIIGVGLLASTSWTLLSRVDLSVGLGPEALFFSGDAVSTEGTAPPPTEVRISPTFAIGAMGSAGVSYRTAPGQAVRLQLAYRAFEPKYKDDGNTSFQSSQFRQLIWTLGYTFTVGGGRP